MRSVRIRCMWEIFAALVVGVLAGTITGLTPGLHINLVAAIVSSFVVDDVVVVLVFLMSMGITHTFLDGVPSVFLGVPDADMALLPGHELVLKGLGHVAVHLLLVGSLLGLLVAVVLLPVLFFVFPFVYAVLRSHMGIVLIFVTLLVFVREGQPWRSLLFLALSGVLGFIVLNMPLREPLFPLLSGLFGVSGLVMSLLYSVVPPAQEVVEVHASPFITSGAVGSGVLAGVVASFLPGFGNAQAASLCSHVKNKFAFLVTLGSINTVNMLASLVTAVTLSKARNGIVVAMLALSDMSFSVFVLLVVASVIAGGCACSVGVFVSKWFAKNLARIPYGWMSLVVLCGLVIAALLLSGVVGVLVLVVASSIGVLCIISETRKSWLMGCLLVPTIVYFMV